MAEQKKKVKTILISQPKPEGKSPYANLEKKHKVKIDFNEQKWKTELLTLLQNLSKSNE